MGIGQVQYKHAAIVAAASGDREIVAAIANHRIAVHGYVLVAAGIAVGTVKFESAAGGTALTGTMNIGADVQTLTPTIICPFSKVPWFITDEETVGTDDALILEVGGSDMAGHLIYSLIQVR